MYRINDKTAAVKTVQKYLSLSIPDSTLHQTGTYDEKTRERVREFQKERNLSQTGSVDYKTFIALYESYRKEIEKQTTRKKLAPHLKFPLKIGYQSNEMLTVNAILEEILRYYGYSTSVRNGRYYSDKTANAVRYVSEIYGLESKDFIDEELYRRIMTDYSQIKLHKE